MNRRTITGVAIASLALLIALLQFLATRYFLYWEFWWFDIVMHFLGGLFIGVSYLWLLRFEASAQLQKRVPVLVSSFFAVFLVGILWEIFEYVTGMYVETGYTLDTMLDLTMDIVGMMSAYLIFRRV